STYLDLHFATALPHRPSQIAGYDSKQNPSITPAKVQGQPAQAKIRLLALSCATWSISSTTCGHNQKHAYGSRQLKISALACRSQPHIETKPTRALQHTSSTVPKCPSAQVQFCRLRAWDQTLPRLHSLGNRLQPRNAHRFV